jgi:hypothetical protein
MASYDPIWALDAGDSLVARETLHLENGGDRKGEIIFTEGRRYVVLRVLPVRMPAAAVVIDDSGTENKIEADFLVTFKVEKG